MKFPIDFMSKGYKIQGKFHFAAVDHAFATLLLLAGFPGNEEDVLELGQRMSEYSINVLTFNYRGIYQSEGIFSLQSTFEDISAAIEYLNQEDVIRKFQIDTTKLVLGGYSYGGGMALAYAVNHPEIRHIFSIAGTDHAEMAREYERNPAFAEMINADFEELRSPIGPVHFERKEAVNELTKNPAPYDLRIAATALADRDILLIGGWNDINVAIEHHILPVYRALISSNAERVQIKAFQDDHTFERTREELATEIIRWLKS